MDEEVPLRRLSPDERRARLARIVEPWAPESLGHLEITVTHPDRRRDGCNSRPRSVRTDVVRVWWRTLCRRQLWERSNRNPCKPGQRPDLHTGQPLDCR